MEGLTSNMKSCCTLKLHPSAQCDAMHNLQHESAASDPVLAYNSAWPWGLQEPMLYQTPQREAARQTPQREAAHQIPHQEAAHQTPQQEAAQASGNRTGGCDGDSDTPGEACTDKQAIGGRLRGINDSLMQLEGTCC